MIFSVYIRPLQIDDANISYQWRNNYKLWKYTGNKPDRFVTREMEAEWINSVQTRSDEARFAICLTDNNQYIGNVFLTNITSKEAEVNIFIGEISKWGKNRACEALWLIINYAFEQLSLNSVYGIVKRKNFTSSAMARRFGALVTKEFYDVQKEEYFAKWVFTKEMYLKHPYTLSRGI